ncbi:MAG: cbb3-type cytochrome c oxidase subunit I, partial [Candidatus Omnitrophica bacterium]|nr:cbb3-type cytochrome c oxidase subunit I [Candidatus Omnitrophota bacterium]
MSNPLGNQRGFIRKYIFSTDHKVIAIQFLITSLFMMLFGGLLAMLVRWQLGWPGRPLGFMEKVAPAGMPGGVMVPEYYNMLFTMHGTVMIFFAIIPLLVGVFGNYLIPLKIGARDMAFPKLNMVSYWMLPLAIAIVLSGFFVEGGAAASGWTAYPPLSTTLGPGQVRWLIGLVILGFSSIFGSINYVTTILNLRAPGMSFHRMPLAIWALFTTAVLTLLATPVLACALILLLMDNTLGTQFFLPAGLIIDGVARPQSGGQPLLWQHLFWFYSHPAVYIMILPAMGMVSDILPVFARKPIFGYRAIAYASLGIGGVGFLVWAHHMFQSGMNPLLGTTFMVSTMVVAVPSAIKTFNWLGTLWGGNIRLTTPMLHALAFVGMFVIGGLSGIFMASTPVDMYIHDTYFIVGHLHYVLFGGSLFGIFGGITFWFPKMFGRMMHERLGKWHFWLTLIFFNGVM